MEDGRFLGVGLSLPDAEGRPAAILVLFDSLDEAMVPARVLRRELIGLSAAGILLALLLSACLSRGVTEPVSRLLAETVRLGSGDLDHPVVPERDDEIGSLARGFEQMRLSLSGAREELIRAERLSAVGQAASSIVHDFSQPLTAIHGHAQLLSGNDGDATASEEDVRVIQQQADRLKGMMREILEFSRGGDRVEFTRGRVAELLDQVGVTTRMTVEAREITLEIEHGFDGEWLLDFPKTTRILENLVRNAAGAIGYGGRIGIRSACSGANLRLEVRDDGPGVPNELLAKLFEPFVTYGKKDGTGLGLAIVRRYTQAQGGTIRVDTSRDGTTFTIEFPPDGVKCHEPSDSSPLLHPLGRSEPGVGAVAGVGSGGSSGPEPGGRARIEPQLPERQPVQRAAREAVRSTLAE